MIFLNSVPTTKYTEYVTFAKKIRLIFVKEVILPYCENLTKHMSSQSEQGFLTVKLIPHNINCVL